MENERILSDSEFEDAYESAVNKAYDMAVAIAQDAKSITARDKWWVAKLEDLFTDHPCDTICEENCKVCSYDLWQSLKQSLNKGIENG